MKLKVVIYNIIFLLVFTKITICQTQEWQNLVALESTRTDVEKILGKPDLSYVTDSSYNTPFGRFYAWYSTGKCRKDVKGLQWDVPAGKLNTLLFYPKQTMILPVNVKATYKKEKKPNIDVKYFYISPDESIIYEVLAIDKDSPEIITSIDIQPSKDKQKFRCKDNYTK